LFFGLARTRHLDGPETVVNGVFTISLPAHEWLAATATAAAPTRASTNQTRATRPTTSDFIAGPENRLAGLAVRSVIERAALETSAADCSPLVLYGPAGSGKSHLAQGLAAWWQTQRAASTQNGAARDVLYLTAAQFAQHYAAAVEAGKIDAWRKRCRGVSLLVIEDIGQLAGKSAAQRELWHTLDALAQRGALVLVTARSVPSQSPNLLAALRSRLSAGLCVPLSLPGTSARRVIVERLCAARGMNLPKRAAHWLADGLTVSAPALLGALMELEMLARQEGCELSAESVRRYVAGYGRGEPLTMRDIANATAKYFRIKVADLKSASRRQSLVSARGVAILLARQLTDLSLEQIGQYLGGRDHTTILNGLRRTERLIRRDPAIHQAAGDLKRLLLNP
jgi:chromosomal replication initiator protein